MPFTTPFTEFSTLSTAPITTTIIFIYIIYIIKNKILMFRKVIPTMKFTCDKSLLAEAINIVCLAVTSKTTIPSLEGILIKCNHQQITLTGYNLELGITKNITAHIQEEGTIILNASLLTNIINKMPNGNITLSTDTQLMTQIQCEDIEFTISGLNAEDYPEIPQINQNQQLLLEQSTFKNMISQTLFAVAQTEQTPIYTGTLFDITPQQLSVVSVDGYRLAMRTEPISQTDTYHFIVPGKTLNEIQKILSKLNLDPTEDIQILVSNKHIIFEISEYHIVSRLLEGDFLDYHNAIPKDYKTKVSIETKDFIDSINRASIIINDRTKSPIKCEFFEDIIKLSCETSLGKIQDSFSSRTEGENVKIGFNNKYMLDALRASESDKILLEMNGPLSPIKILPMQGNSFLFLVLPVRLKD